MITPVTSCVRAGMFTPRVGHPSQMASISGASTQYPVLKDLNLIMLDMFQSGIGLHCPQCLLFRALEIRRPKFRNLEPSSSMDAWIQVLLIRAKKKSAGPRKSIAFTRNA